MGEKIGFIGTGQLGLPMAMNLLDAGYALRVYNRTAQKAEPLVARGAELAARAAEVLAPGGVVVSVLWDDASLDEVVTRDGFLERLGPGGVHLSMTTVSPETARRVAELHTRHGCAYVEATVFGRPDAAAAKKLWMPVAGAAAAKERIGPLLAAIGAAGVFDFGEAIGAATTAKLAGNFLIISAARSLAEAAAMVEKRDVDPAALIEMLTSTLLDAPIYRSYGERIAERRPPMQSPIPFKDIGLFKRTAADASAPTPIADRLYEMLAGEPR